MEITVPVSRIAFGGDGVARLPDGKVCFIPGALPGETVRAEITHEAKSFARARVLDVLTASPERIEPDCPLAGTCPGCAYRHASYDCELEWKNRQFTDFLTRGNPAGKDIRFLPPLGAPSRNGCRNKLSFVCENGAFCYRGLDNKTAHSSRPPNPEQTEKNARSAGRFTTARWTPARRSGIISRT